MLNTPIAGLVVHLVAVRGEECLLLRRQNTGYGDGMWALPAGHVEPNESATSALIRETFEEIGIMLHANNLIFLHAMHRTSSESIPYIHFFFAHTIFEERPIIGEPDKCSDLRWFKFKSLPNDILPHVEYVLTRLSNCTLQGYSEGIHLRSLQS